MTQQTQQKTNFEWHHFDASTRPLGRLATDIAVLLMGKHRADYAPNTVAPVYVIVTNTDNVQVTGQKETQKMYRWYTGYPGGIKERSLRDQRQRDSRKIVAAAVEGMLPKNSLRPVLMTRLKLYPGIEHPHMAQLA